MRPDDTLNSLEWIYGQEGAALIRLWFTAEEIAAIERAALHPYRRQTRDLLERALVAAYQQLVDRRAPKTEAAQFAAVM